MPATLSYTGKLVSVIKSRHSWLDMSVCKLDCNEDIFVTVCINPFDTVDALRGQ